MKVKLFLLLILLIFNQTYSYFYAVSKELRKFYPYEGFEKELEVDPFHRKNRSAWGSINFFRKKAFSPEIYHHTNLLLIPASLRLKYQLSSSQLISPYLGLGFSYSILNIKNISPEIKNHLSRDDFGYVIKSGSYVAIRQDLLLDLFVDCYFQKVKLQSFGKDQIGGYRVGGSLGYRF